MRRGPSLGRVPAAPVPRRLRYYACATTPCTASPRLISSPAGTTLRLLIRSLSPAGRGGPGPFVSAGGPCSGARTGTVQGLPGSLASHPVALRTVFDPGRSAGASPLAAPPVLPPLFRRRRHRRLGFRGSIASLHHPLCTLHDMRYRTPCNTRSRLAGSASAGRVSNPLARGEKFQLIASSFLGLTLAQQNYLGFLSWLTHDALHLLIDHRLDVQGGHSPGEHTSHSATGWNPLCAYTPTSEFPATNCEIWVNSPRQSLKTYSYPCHSQEESGARGITPSEDTNGIKHMPRT